MMTSIKTVTELCMYLLGVVVAGFIFLFCICLLFAAAFLALMIARELWDQYLKDVIRRLKNGKVHGDDRNI